MRKTHNRTGAKYILTQIVINLGVRKKDLIQQGPSSHPPPSLEYKTLVISLQTEKEEPVHFSKHNPVAEVCLSQGGGEGQPTTL